MEERLLAPLKEELWGCIVNVTMDDSFGGDESSKIECADGHTL